MIELRIVTPQGKLLETQVNRLSLPTSDGVRTILPRHMEVVTTVEIGIVRLIGGQHTWQGKTSDNLVLAVSEGIFHFKDNKGQVFVRTFELPEEIDRARAQRAKERAEAALTQFQETQAHHEAELALKRALIRLSASSRG